MRSKVVKSVEQGRATENFVLLEAEVPGTYEDIEGNSTAERHAPHEALPAPSGAEPAAVAGAGYHRRVAPRALGRAP